VIAVDTSALMAVILGDAEADRCIKILAAETDVLISAGTLAEVIIVAGRRNVAREMSDLIDALGFEIVPVTAASAERIGQAYERWGKRMHVAGLNFGDCFAYEVAKQHSCSLLFVGENFSKTDLEPAV
jgi:ribonuclease VapC